jgi:hypothetical protein
MQVVIRASVSAVLGKRPRAVARKATSSRFHVGQRCPLANAASALRATGGALCTASAKAVRVGVPDFCTALQTAVWRGV